MTHHTDAERAAFEEFASVNGERPELVARNQAGEYQRLDTATGWMWWQAARRAPAAPSAWKDNDTAKLVNDLRDCAVQYHATAQLRERIAHLVRPLAARLAGAPAAPVPQGWIDPNDKAQKQYLPHIGERVLFKHDGRVYLGKHTGGSFKAEYPFGKTFGTWDCMWMYPSALDAAAPHPPEAEENPLQEPLDEALQSLEFYKRRCDLLQSIQPRMRDPERTMVCDVLANGHLLQGGDGQPDKARYAPPEAAPVPQFSRIAQKKLDYLLEAGEAITGYAIENKDGRRGAIDCHGFVYWWQDAAAPQLLANHGIQEQST